MIPIEISLEARRALSDLSTTSRSIQRNGDVTGSRRVDSSARILEQELRTLVEEKRQLQEELTAGRAAELKLQDEITELKNTLEEQEREAEVHPLPADYWETAE